MYNFRLSFSILLVVLGPLRKFMLWCALLYENVLHSNLFDKKKTLKQV